MKKITENNKEDKERKEEKLYWLYDLLRKEGEIYKWEEDPSGFKRLKGWKRQ